MKAKKMQKIFPQLVEGTTLPYPANVNHRKTNICFYQCRLILILIFDTTYSSSF